MSVAGFIGLGLMGDGIAAALQRRGIHLIVYDIDNQAAERVVGRGATAAASVREVADAADIIFSCLPTTEACRSVALGDGGIVEGTAVRTYIEISTMGSGLSREISDALHGRGIAFLDAPVSGGVDAAYAGELTSIVAGSAAALATARPLIEHYSGRIFHVGEQAGKAQLAKLINNAISIFGILATFEGLALADRAGVDKQLLTDIINVSTGANFASRVLLPRSVLADVPAPIGKMAVLTKDVDAYLDEAALLGIEPPVASQLAAIAHAVGNNPVIDVAAGLRGYFGTLFGSDGDVSVNRTLPEI